MILSRAPASTTVSIRPHRQDLLPALPTGRAHASSKATHLPIFSHLSELGPRPLTPNPSSTVVRTRTLTPGRTAGAILSAYRPHPRGFAQLAF